jgi:hypothetical protein
VTRPPARCFTCQRNRVAWVTPRVDYCYDCLPGGPFPAPACRSCGSPDYFSQGQCDRCHPGGPRHLGSCRGCLAWGVVRRYSWLCWPCRWWKTHYPPGTCRFCGRDTWIAAQGACRLCVDHARMLAAPGRAPDLAGATRDGQQLFLANVRGHARHAKIPALVADGHPPARPFTPSGWRQQVLFDLAPDPEVVRREALRLDSDLVAYCATIVAEHAATYGWSKRQRNSVIASLRMLAYLQDTPDAKIHASDVLGLPRYDGNIVSTLEVLDAAGLLIDDRPALARRYFADKTVGLPPPMLAQLETWLEVMLDGSHAAPRRRARDPQTVRLHIMGIAPILHTWADAGHVSLTEITSHDILAALPPSGAHRNFADSGLRSLFTILKSRKLVFLDPTRAVPAARVNVTIPMPLDTDAIRDALDSPDPAIALAVALVAFHALTSKQLQQLKLTDIIDGRLTLDRRTIPLAGPVRVRLRAWLDHRATTWPHTINPYLFVSFKSAPRLVPVGRQFPWTKTRLKPQALREDRILQEIHATGGDIRRICDLFGLTVTSALRYAKTLGHPDLADRHEPASS